MIFNTDNISFKIRGENTLNLKNLDVKSQEHLLLLGESGSGKTTLLNLLSGLLRPSSGDISYLGQNYANLSNSELNKLRLDNFGFVFQKLHLIGHLSVNQNIALAQSPPAPDRIKRILDDLGMTNNSNKKARDLSVGEAQRVAIARAVANNPNVIFADEPTSALDDKNTERVMDMLFDQVERTGATLITATHDARIKERFNQVLEMDK